MEFSRGGSLSLPAAQCNEFADTTGKYIGFLCTEGSVTLPYIGVYLYR